MFATSIGMYGIGILEPYIINPIFNPVEYTSKVPLLLSVIRDVCIYTSDKLSDKDEVISYPRHIQQSREKHHKSPLPDVRVISLKKYIKTGPHDKCGTHASPIPHDRRGTRCISKLGKEFWRRPSKVLGGRKEPAINVIKTK
jgi:hypothetical protein